jgi:PIN domain nuclease of toxin-antitoxin system
MELKVKNNMFYLLDAITEKWIFEDEESAVEKLRTIVSTGKEITPEKVCIYEINTSGENWAIKSVPWAKIAMKLMKGGK